MNEVNQALEHVPMFKHLTEDERHRVEALASRQVVEAGTPVFREGDSGESMYVLLDGAVELRTALSGSMEKSLITLRRGGVFGLVELIEPAPRQVSACAVEKTELLELERKTLQQFIGEHPGPGMDLLFALSVGLSRQIRLLLDILRDNLLWTMETSGAAQLNLQQLITDDVQLVLDLNTGQQVTGRLLKLESGPAGYDLIVKLDDGSLRLIPYHAVSGLSFTSRGISSGAVPDDEPQEDPSNH